MAAITKRVLSGSVDGLAIAVSSTSGGVITAHTGPSSSSIIDEVWLYATNELTTTISLVVEWGASSSLTAIYQDIVPREGPQLVAPGLVIQGNATPKVISVWGTVKDQLVIHGYVNRLDQS